MNMLYHIAKRSDWEIAQVTGEYTISTLNKKLSDVGYIHLSFSHQVNTVADFVYKDEDNLLLLKINPDELESEIKVEEVAGTDKKFPHLYGVLNLKAVVGVSDYTPANGSFPVVTES